ncbi:ATP-binding protein [Streptomyces hyderabadensis]|uniref:RRM domain-containing protein n=1 Tax=Streptomyces hyderabadensis TaxID=598549 RepID=A0ABP9I0N9_9ACTN|nr:ATP-binding protein [Streptomyces hyderabadensis]
MTEFMRVQEKIQLARELGESQFREFKSALQGPPDAKVRRPVVDVCRDIAEALVGFANAEGGELLVGVEDDGSITGVRHSEADIQRMLAAPADRVMPETPLPTPVRLRAEFDGKMVLYFSVDKGTEHVHQTTDGKCLQRNDLETRPISTGAINLERQERASREYDRQYVDGATIGDLDTSLIERARDKVAPGHSVEAFLGFMKLMDFSTRGVQLRRAALLLFAQDVTLWHPRCEVRIFRVQGNEVRTGRDYNVSKSVQVAGALFQLISEAWDQLRPYLVETKFGPEGTFEEKILYPEDACLEALTNAIAHRDYSNEGRPIEIYVFDNRIEVKSPGGLLSNVTIGELRQLKGVHQSRNAYLARVLRELGYMREMGEGMRRIFHLMRVHDLVEPELQADPSSFTITLHHRSVFSPEAQRWVTAFDKFNLTREEARVVLLGQNNSRISPQQIIDALDIVDTDQLRSVVEQLQTKGILINVLTKVQVNNLVKREKLSSRRLVRKFAIRPPFECERFLSQFLMEVIREAGGSVVTVGSVKRAVGRLPIENPYSNPGTRGAFGALLALGLIDDQGNPIGRLRSLTLSGELVAPEPVKSKSQSRDIATAGADPEESVVEDFESGRDSETPRKVYVGNLPFSATSKQLEEVARQYGKVLNVSVPLDLYTGNSRGYGFVEYARESDATAAKNGMRKHMWGEHRISTAWARARK